MTESHRIERPHSTRPQGHREFRTAARILYWPGWLLLALGGLGPADGATLLVPDFQNRIYLNRPPGGSAPLPAVAFFGGHVDARPGPLVSTNGDAGIRLVQSAFGQALSLPAQPRFFYCADPTGYHLWLGRWFAEQNYLDPRQAGLVWGAMADPDGDHYDNLFEYATGSDPGRSQGSNPVAITSGMVDGTNYFFATFRRRIDDPALQLTAKISTNLLNWDDVATRFVLSASVAVEPGVVQETYRDVIPLKPSDSRFVRLLITYHNETPPTVTWQFPAENAVVAAARTLFLQAGADDPDGCVVLVEFFVNGQWLGNVVSGDAVLPWTPSIPGEYEVTVRVFDNFGMATTASRHVVVDSDRDRDGIPDRLDPRPTFVNEPPHILALSVSSPDNFHSPGLIHIAVSRFDPDGDSNTLQVLLDSMATAVPQPVPGLTLDMAGVNPGPHRLEVRTVDRWGASEVRAQSIHLFRRPPLP